MGPGRTAHGVTGAPSAARLIRPLPCHSSSLEEATPTVRNQTVAGYALHGAAYPHCPVAACHVPAQQGNAPRWTLTVLQPPRRPQPRSLRGASSHRSSHRDNRTRSARPCRRATNRPVLGGAVGHTRRHPHRRYGGSARLDPHDHCRTEYRTGSRGWRPAPQMARVQLCAGHGRPPRGRWPIG